MASDTPVIRDFREIAGRISTTIAWLTSDYGLKIKPSSPLEWTLVLMQRECDYCNQHRVAASGLISPSQMRAIRGLELICERIAVARERTGIPDQFRGWIQKLGIGLPSMCSCYDDYPPDVYPRDQRAAEAVRQASTDLFELVVGLAALSVSKDVVLERGGPTGKPDVRVTVNGVTWGLACRVTNSRRIEQHFSGVANAAQKTVKHLNNGFAARAVIVLGGQNVFDRQSVVLPDYRTAQLSMKRRADEFSKRIQQHVDEDRRGSELLDLDARIVPGIITYFEEVFTITQLHSVRVLPASLAAGIGFETYVPSTYSQYITFGNRGLSLSGVPEQLLVALAGPESENVGEISEIA